MDLTVANELQELAKIDPVGFQREYIGADPWEKQAEITRSVWEYSVTSVRSCHGTGKSWVAARIVGAYMLAHPGCVVVTTAPTGRQVKDVLWREMRAMNAQSAYPLGGEMKTVVWDLAPDWFAFGFATDDPDNFSGPHSDNYLVVVDEAAGVDEGIYEAISGTMTSDNSRMLMIGNPTSMSGRFYDSHRSPSARTNKIRISCFDTPNFTYNGIETVEQLRDPNIVEAAIIVQPKLISPRWAADRLEEWGEESPMFQARVLGEFASQGIDTLIPLNWIEAAMTPERRKAVVAKGGSRHMGIDVARFGTDKTVFASRVGDAFDPLETHTKESITTTFGRLRPVVMSEAQLYPDDIGVGGGLTDMLKDMKQGNVHPVNVSEKPSDPQFVNLRAELYWNLRKKLENGEVALPNDKELESELASIKVKYTPRGIQIESKDDMRKRLRRSPDKADAVVLSYAGRKVGTYLGRGPVGPQVAGPITQGLTRKQF